MDFMEKRKEHEDHHQDEIKQEQYCQEQEDDTNTNKKIHWCYKLTKEKLHNHPPSLHC